MQVLFQKMFPQRKFKNTEMFPSRNFHLVIFAALRNF